MRATTAKLRKRLSAVMMSSTMPSRTTPAPGRRRGWRRAAPRGSGSPARPPRRPPARGSDEAVADARHGHDPVLPVVGLAERLAQRGDLHGQVALLDDGVGPGAGEEVGLAHGPAGRLGEGREHRERALAERRRARRRAAARRARCRARTDRRRTSRLPCPSIARNRARGSSRADGRPVPHAHGGHIVGVDYGYDLTDFSRIRRRAAAARQIIATRVGFSLIWGARGLICDPTTPTHAPL